MTIPPSTPAISAAKSPPDGSSFEAEQGRMPSGSKRSWRWSRSNGSSPPHSPPQVLGLCTLRREVIPVIELDRSAVEGMARTGRVPDDGRHPENRPRTMGVPGEFPGDNRGRGGARGAARGDANAEAGADLGITGTVRRDEEVYAVIDPEATWKLSASEWRTGTAITGDASRRRSATWESPVAGSIARPASALEVRS